MANQCKYYKEVLQVSYDSGVTWVNMGETRKGDLYEYNSPACGAIIQYRWVDVTGQYTCEGTTKYQKTKKQYSEDGGVTWQDVSPAEYGKGNVIEYQSSDCGYVPPPSYSGEYLTFVAIDDGQFRFAGSTGNNVSNDYISYSMDEGSTWSTLASGTYSPTVYAGQKIMWKGNLTAPGIVGEGYLTGVGRFSSSDRFNIEGNIMSLLYGDNFQDKTTIPDNSCEFCSLFCGCWVVSAENLVLPATTLAEYCYNAMFAGCTSLLTAPSLPATTLAESCYQSMFKGCTSLTTAPELPATTLVSQCYIYMFSGCTSLTSAPTLPATTLADNCYNAMFAGCTSLLTAPSLPATTLEDSCYTDMFKSCTSLTTAPELPATTLAERCYNSMFYNCTSLTTAPELPATTLDYTCYSHMFSHCTSLTTAPVLPATTLKIWCYQSMFDGCTSLNYIKCLATNISASQCTDGWVTNVASSGTFVKDSDMSSWTTGVNGIPTNWTVQNA